MDRSEPSDGKPERMSQRELHRVWPRGSHLTVDVPIPLEQYLAELADGILGCTPAEVAIALIREGIATRIDRLQQSGFRPDLRRYEP
jgi:hypothetical protein